MRPIRQHPDRNQRPLTYTCRQGQTYTSGSQYQLQVVDNGVYVVTMTVNDATQAATRDPHDQRGQRRPDADAHWPYRGRRRRLRDSDRQCDRSANTPTTPTNNDPLTYTWSVTKDGNAYTSGVGNVATSSRRQRRLCRHDDRQRRDTGSDTETHTINVANVNSTLTLTDLPWPTKAMVVTVTVRRSTRPTPRPRQRTTTR